MKTKMSVPGKNGEFDIKKLMENLKGIKPESNGVYQIPIRYVRKYGRQPRKWINPVTLEELAGSMKEVGQMEAGIVIPLPKPDGEFYFELESGERRIRACELANIDFFRTGVDTTVKLEIDQFERAMIVNFCREDPPIMDTAWSIDRLKKEKGLTNDEIAKRIGKSKGFVDQYHGLTRLHPQVQEMLHPKMGEKQLPMVVALKLVKYPQQFQLERAQQIIRNEEPEQPRMSMVEAIHSIERGRVQAGLTSYEPRPDKSFDVLAGFLKRTARQLELHGDSPPAVLESTVQGRKDEPSQKNLIDTLQIIIAEATSLRDSIQGIINKTKKSSLPPVAPKTVTP
jgi:ParB/RepB/Spo0J family partition protein